MIVVMQLGKKTHPNSLKKFVSLNSPPEKIGTGSPRRGISLLTTP
jgi:hypothetical protein